MAARSQIRTIFVSFTVNTRINVDGHAVEHTSERKTWMDGTKIRAEYMHSKGPDVGVRYLDCVNCEKDRWGIAASDAKGFATTFFPLDTPGRPSLRDALDPRSMGYYPTIYVTLKRFPINSLVGSGNRNPPTVTEEVLDGTSCWVVRWDTQSKSSCAVWIVPSKGHNVTRIEAIDRSSEPARRLVVTSALSPAGQTGLWFPSRVVFRESRAEATVQEETIDIHEVRLNDPVPPELFTLAGAQLKPTPYVLTPDSKQSGFLVDGKIDASREHSSQFEDLTPPVLPRRRINYWLVGLTVACTALTVALVVLRRRRPNPPASDVPSEPTETR